MSHDLIGLRLTELSDRIRRARDASNLTMVELGKKSGVSPSTIQKIESRQMIPSVAVIFRIATGLGVEPADLIAPSEPAPLDLVLQRSGEQLEMKASPELKFVKLSGDLKGSDFQVWRIEIGANHQTTLARPQKFDEVILVGLTGRVEINLDNQLYLLGRDDSLHCKSKTMYALRNTGGRPAAYISAARYPHTDRVDVRSPL